ncbi:MAG TPA: ketol-acid reductoisomerase [Bdellovibrionota bacterium]|jgi:ketol-acid reductoisomerase
MREITLVGYGNQGKAWAANLRDSGWKVTVSGRPEGRGLRASQEAGFSTLEAGSLRSHKGAIALLLPDESIRPFFAKYLAGGSNRQFLFAHGFAVTYQRPEFSSSDDVVLVAPKGIGQKLRENFLAGSGVMGVLAVDQDASGTARSLGHSVAEGLGLTRVGVIETSFAAETKCDLLSEQVILCGAVPRLVKETTEFLVRAGIDPQLASYECLNELKLIVDMMVEHGVDGMLARVSTAARFGGEEAADTILPKGELRERTCKLWNRIENGIFAEALATHLENKRTLILEKAREVSP